MHGRTVVVVGMAILVVLGTGAMAGATVADSMGPASSASEVDAAGKTYSAVQRTCDYESLYDETISSVVTVQVVTEDGPGLGTGFVYDDAGHVVTNQHVVAGAEYVEVQFDGGEWRTAEVVGEDVYSDLAVLAVDDAPDYADPLALKTSEPERGQPVAALGSPLGLEGTITDGIVSGTNRSLPAGDERGPQFSIPNAIQTTAAINPGNSGGPLVNCRGKVLGVSTATLAQTDNTGFAVPASRVERVVPELITDGTYETSFLGVSSIEVSPIVADANDLGVTRGVLVRDVFPGSPADGVLQGGTGTERVNGLEVPLGGDVILAIDGERIDSREALSSYLVQTRPGEAVTLTILRDGERLRVTVTVAERPQPAEIR